MTRKTKGHYRTKHPPGTAPNPRLLEEIRIHSLGNSLPCVDAMKIARERSVGPVEVGRTADLIEVRISRCQLGLFGYEPEKRIVKPLPSLTQNLITAIRDRLISGRLPCATAFALAEEFSLSRLTVSSACETLGIKICSCQLGAF